MAFDDIDSLLSGIDVDEVKKNKENSTIKRVVKKEPVERSNSKLTGPLTLILDTEYKFDEGYSDEIIQFKEFLDGLGNVGMTFEEFFDLIEKKFGKDKVGKTKNALYRMNVNNQCSMKMIREISSALGYSVTLKFDKDVNSETNSLFDNEVKFS
jgi:hypothetical protein